MNLFNIKSSLHCGKKSLLLTSILFFSLNLKAQESFSVSIVPMTINGAPALHSFAYGTLNGKWLFIGGRTNGLHDFEPPFAFPNQYANDSIFVVDINASLSWGVPASSLPDTILQSISSTNMEFYQDSTTLYLFGGYGYDNSVSDYRTFARLTAIDLNGLINAVIANNNINSYFRQIVDSNLAITGGNIDKIDSTYYLTFGQRFDGRYNRIDTLGFFYQHYSRQIRKFTIHDDGINLSINNYQTIDDTVNFRRRDYNLVHQIFPNRQEGITAFGGVFQYNALLPYLTPIDISPSTYNVINSFNQNLEQYSTACMPVYDSIYNAMHTIFFGGISLYYFDSTTNIMTMDTLVPFVNTISKITRDSNGILTEYQLPITMPGLMGTNAQFIINPAISSYRNKIINLDTLTGNTLVGYIVGGLTSTLPNISDQSPPPSYPSNIIYKVYIDKTITSQDIPISNSILNFIVYPNPTSEFIKIQFSTTKQGRAEVSIFDNKGSLVENIYNEYITSGSHELNWKPKHIPPGEYFCRIKIGYESKTMRFVFEK
jgi:hypothetical protein